MADPWERYSDQQQGDTPAPSGPWERYGGRSGQSAPPTTADTVSDVATQVPMGFNRGLDAILNLPGDIMMRIPMRLLGLGQYAPERGHYATRFNPGGSLYFGSRTTDEPQTTPGRFAGSVGEALGATAVPGGALLGTSESLAALGATTLWRAIGQTIGRQIAGAPGAAAVADVASATGAGLAQEGAREAGAGPIGQAAAGLVGGLTPAALTGVAGGMRRTLDSALARRDPSFHVAEGLGDATVGDLADAVAVGTTRQDLGINRRVLDILGEEMVRAGGNRTAAVNATEARLVASGIAPSTAQDQIRRLLSIHAGDNLMLGEYPAVMGGNMATREASPYAPRSTVGRQATDIFQEEYTRAGGDVAAAEHATIDRLVAGGTPRAQATQYVGRIRQSRPTDTQLGAVAEPGTQQLMDMVANAGSMASSQNVRTAIGQRAANLGQRLLDTVRGLSPGGRTIRDVENMVANLRGQAQADYAAAHAPGAVNQGSLYAGLSRVIRSNLAQLRGRSGPVAEALGKAIDSFYVSQPTGIAARQEALSQQPALAARISTPMLQEDLASARLALREARRQGAHRDVTDRMSRNIDDIVERLRLARRDATIATDRSLPTSLQVVQDARSELYGEIVTARTQGRPSVARALQALYNDVTAVMQRASPAWARANQRWADMRLDEMAAELGQSFAKGAGPQLRQQLREFQRLAPEAQDVVRVHFVQKLLDEIEHEIRLGGQTNLGKLFDRQDKRNMIRAILGDQAANVIVRAARDANVMQRSMAGIRGSQTHLRGQVQREQDNELRTIASAAQFDWRHWREAALEHVIAVMRENRNRTIGRAVTTPMRDVPAVAEQIERMRQAAERVRAARTPGQTRLPTAGALAPAIIPAIQGQ